jgi:hypothetical protein
MRLRAAVVVVVLVVAASFSRGQQQPQAQGTPAVRPNVVLIMSDDLGYGDLSSYGATDIKTPVIDKIGEDGIRLTDFYANGVLCSPSRAGLITGRYQQRYAIENALGERNGSCLSRPAGHSAVAQEQRVCNWARRQVASGASPSSAAFARFDTSTVIRAMTTTITTIAVRWRPTCGRTKQDQKKGT